MRRIFPLALLPLLVLSTLSFGAPQVTAAEHLVLKVGGQDEMKTRNPLPAIGADDWTEDVLHRVYDRPVKEWPEGVLRPFLAKGIDADEDGIFEPGEYGVWTEAPSAQTPLTITVYYDFNGVRWHDGVQMTVWDVFFSYHLAAMNPRFNNDLRVLFCAVGASYESCGRQLNLGLASKNWEGEDAMPGDSSLRAAVEFRPTEPYALFAERTLAPLLFPSHVWSRTGGGSHADFGCAVWIPPAEADGKWIPECRAADSTKWGKGIATTETVPSSFPYRYNRAEDWNVKDADVIGSGPFRFRTWTVEVVLDRFDDYHVGGIYDRLVASFLHAPRIEGIRFLRYGTLQGLIYALQNGEIDVIRGNVGPLWFPELFPNPYIAVESNAEPGFFYMAYNLRREPWGYANGDPAQGDRGYWFRQAVAHLVDKKSIVQNLLQNFGVVGNGLISPANTFWYNDNIPKSDYDLEKARTILDDLATPGGIYDPGFSLDPGSTTDCNKDNPSGCRSLPRIGNQVFEIYMPQVDYDPVRASAGAMIADAMRQVGLNARTGSFPSSSPFCFRDFDLFILGWRIRGTDPDYLYSFFHSSNWPCGQNYPGVENATLDAVLDASRREMDRNVRRQFIFDAQVLLADIRPYEVMYYRTNIEAYRQDRFVNWTVVSGSIWNEWSLFGIRPPGAGVLHLTVTAPTAIPSETSESVRFAVRDGALGPVEGATISVQIESMNGEDPGTLTSGTETGTSLTLVTDSGGNAAARYDAPVVFGTTRPVFLRAIASHGSSESDATQEAVMNVVGSDLAFFRIRLSLPAGDLAYPNATLPVRLDVRDRDGALQPDAHIAIRLQPAGESSYVNGSAVEGQSFFVRFPAPGIYTIRADVTDPAFLSHWTYVTVWVVEPADGTRPPPPTERSESPVLAVTFLAVTSLVITATVAWWWRRTRKPH